MRCRVLLAISVAFALLGGAWGCSSPAPRPSAHEERVAPAIPEPLREPGRRVWQGGRATWKHFSSGSLSPITDVVVGSPGAGPEQILVAGPYGAFTTGQFPGEGHIVTFADPGDESIAWDVQVIDLDGDGTNEFVNRGGNWHPVSAWASDGRLLWRQGLEWGVNQMAPGDLDGDDHPDFVIGMSGRGGLRRIDAEGRQLWRVPGSNIWDVELVDLDGDGRDEIVHSCCRGISIRRADGSLLREVTLDPSPSSFEIVAWLDLRIVYARKDRLWLARPDGSGSTSYSIGFDPEENDLRARVFAADRGRTALAVLIDSRIHDRSVLNLYDTDGSLFHQEVLPWSCPELEVLETGDPDGDVLLLGCNGWLVLHGPYLPLWHRSIGFIEAAKGPNSPDLLEDLESLSWALVHRNRPEEALIYATRAEVIARKAPSGNRLASALNTLGMVEQDLGRSDAARSNLETALGIVDPEEPDGVGLLRDIHYNLGSVFYANGQLDQAEAHLLRSLGDRAIALHPADRAKSAHNLANVYLRQSRLADAEKMVRMAIENDTAAYSADQEEVSEDLRLLSKILRAAGRMEEAREVEARTSAQAGQSAPPPASAQRP